MPPAPASPNRRHLASAIVDLLHDEFDPQEKLLVASFEPENGQIFENEDRLSNRALTVRGPSRVSRIAAVPLCRVHARRKCGVPRNMARAQLTRDARTLK
jgi:hypothetical protein